MRIVVMSAALLMLAACDAGPAQTGVVRTADMTSTADAALAATAFDYRYTVRLPGNRIEAVQNSHARGCDQLGPARCRITIMRYNVDDHGNIAAVLTLKLDPTIARAFGKAAIDTVTDARGALTDAEVAGPDSAAAAGRSDTVITRLRESLGNAEAQLRGALPDDQKAPLEARANRLRSAIATIGETDQGTGTGVATTPVILTYTSGGPLPALGGSTDASFDTAGDTFLASLAGLLAVLASIGPWMVLLLGGALGLRWLLGRTEAATPAPELPPAPREEYEENRNVIQRWFQREDQPEHERVD